MQTRSFYLVLFFLFAGALLLACRTADLLTSVQTTALPTSARVTRAALRPTFTPIPSDTNVPPPTETPVPTDAPTPTEAPVPTDTDVPTRVPSTRKPPTETPEPPTDTREPPTPTASPDLPWFVSSGPNCTTGDNNQSSVTGTIKANDKAAVGQFVQASAGPGGEPISDVPARSDTNGNYKVTLICGSAGCNGDFWLWMVDASKRQISPFVKFHFSNDCRKGTLDFQKR